MLFMVEMDVNIPVDFDPDAANALKAEEKAFSQTLQADGRWRHLWRKVGLYSNVSIFDVEDGARLHDLLMGLPLYRFMTLKITPLCRHPSAIRDDDS